MIDITDIKEREEVKYRVWSEYVEDRERLGKEHIDYFRWLDAMGLD